MVTSAVSAIGTARTSSGRSTVASDGAAAFQLEASAIAASEKPITWLPESPRKTAAGLLPPDVEGEEAGTREGNGEGKHEDEVVRVHRDGIDREVGACDPGHGRRDAVHVVEQVERVRHPDQPDDRERDGDPVVLDQLDRQPVGEHDRRRAALRRQLRRHRQPERVVEQPDGEEQGCGADDREERVASAHRADGDCEHDPRDDRRRRRRFRREQGFRECASARSTVLRPGARQAACAKRSR